MLHPIDENARVKVILEADNETVTLIGNGDGIYLGNDTPDGLSGFLPKIPKIEMQNENKDVVWGFHVHFIEASKFDEYKGERKLKYASLKAELEHKETFIKDLKKKVGILTDEKNKDNIVNG